MLFRSSIKLQLCGMAVEGRRTIRMQSEIMFYPRHGRMRKEEETSIDIGSVRLPWVSVALVRILLEK